MAKRSPAGKCARAVREKTPVNRRDQPRRRPDGVEEGQVRKIHAGRGSLAKRREEKRLTRKESNRK